MKNIKREIKFSGFTLEKMPDALIWVDSNACIHYVNEAACKLGGYSKEELIGKKAYDFTPGENKAQWEKNWTELLEKREIIFEKYQGTKNGKLIPVEVNQNLIEHNGTTYSCSVVRDITERKQAETELKQALSKVEQLKNQLEEENIYLQHEIKLTHNFNEIICKNNTLKKVLNKVEQVASTDAAILILGETGTGKELIARAVQNLSERRHRPLVKVNCAALPIHLIESELFGHEKGAFTGAFSLKKGRFELADGGTIFLDEIGDMPIELQPKLLRILQEGEFERLGSLNTIKTDIRIISATNKNLQSEVKAGRFREDLYYRLNVVPIQIPPLRDRMEDLPILVNHFILKYCKKTGKKIKKIPSKVMTTLQSYNWPGNVRELENIIERAVILSRGNYLSVAGWFDKEVPTQPANEIATLDEIQKKHILKVLELKNWRISGEKGAAKILGINPKTLESRMRKLGLHRD